MNREVDHGKAFEFTYLFLNEQMPLVSHIFKIYETSKNSMNLVIVIWG